MDVAAAQISVAREEGDAAAQQHRTTAVAIGQRAVEQVRDHDPGEVRGHGELNLTVGGAEHLGQHREARQVGVGRQ